nr:MAG TPA: hypothetical protein [Caudoviricetes sp.]
MTDIADADLQKVLEKGNETNLSIQFNTESDNITVISADGLTTTIGTRALKIGADGFTDAGQPVLSANPDNTINSIQAQQMRNFLDVFSKAEVNTKISSDIDSTVATLNALIKTADDKAAAAQTTATQALTKATTLENAGYQTAEDVRKL